MTAGQLTNDNSGRGRFFRYAPVVIWTVLILFLSSSAGSSNNTSLFIGPLLKWLFPAAPEEVLAVYHGYIRKGAHLFMYGGLAVIAWRAFRGSMQIAFARFPWLSALLLVAAVGSVDELNQSYNLLRTGRFEDVLIDLSGGIIALIVIGSVKRIFTAKSQD